MTDINYPIKTKPVTFDTVWCELDNLIHTLRQAQEACGVKVGSSKIEAPPRDAMQLAYCLVRADKQLVAISRAYSSLIAPPKEPNGA